LAAAAQQGLQAAAFGSGQRPRRRAEGVGEVGQDGRVEGVVLGERPVRGEDKAPVA
jgi:hypothetical protein